MQLPSDITVRWMTHDPAQEQALARLLSEEEQARLATFTLAKRRQEFVLGRAAARLLLAERLEVAPANVPLTVSEDGGVDVVGADLFVSIAHSGKHAVATIAERVVGVDLERIAPRHHNLPRFLLHPDEFDVLEALPLDETRAHILYWTVKEASLKALRTGFRLSPKKLRLDVDLAAQTAQIHVHDGRRLDARFEERQEYYIAVSFEPD